MKLPPPQEFKRIGLAALKKSLDPSALERGLQYLREQGLVSISLNSEKSNAQASILTIHTQEGCTTEVEISTSSKPMYSSCTCSLAGYAIFCKHQALAAWCVAGYASQNYDYTRMDEEIIHSIKNHEPVFIQALQRLTSRTHSSPTALSSVSVDPTFKIDLVSLVVALPFSSQATSFEKWASLEVAHAAGPSLLPDISIPYLREGDLPHPLWRSPVSFKPTQPDPNHDQRLKRCLFYVFTDQVQVPVSEILFHPYAKLIPSDLLPLASNIKEEWQNQTDPFPFLISKPKNHYEQRLNFILVSLLQQAQQYSSRGKLKMYFADQNTFEKNQMAAPLTQVQWAGLDTDPSLSSIFKFQSHQLGEVEVTLSENPSALWEETFAFSQSEHLLVFHLDSEWKTRHPEGLILKTSAQIEATFESLQSDYGVSLSRIQSNPPIEIKPLIPHSKKIGVHSNGTLGISLEIDEGVFSGIPNSILKIAQTLQDGIRAALPEALAFTSDTKKNTRRSSDTRLLKHSGVSQLVFQETLKHLINPAESFAVFFEGLKKKVALYLNKLDGAPQSGVITLELYCSKPAIEFLEQYCKQLQHLYETQLFPVFSPNSNSLYKGVYAFYLKTLFAWSLHSTIQNTFFSEEDQWRDLVWNSHENSPKFIFNTKEKGYEVYLKAFLPLQNEGVQLSLDGESVEELHDGDFISEFVLEEFTDPQSTTFQKIDWFELHPKFFFKGVEVSEEQALKLSQTGMLSFQGKVYRLNPGTIPSLEKLTTFWDQLAQQMAPNKRQRKMDRIYKLPRHSILELLILRENGVQVRGGPFWEKICKFYDSLKQERKTINLPAQFTGELKPYQHRGVQWIHDLYHLGLGGILADDMGLGKTVQTLAFFSHLFEEKDLHHCLIVVPTSLTYNWFSEAQRFAPHLPVHLFQSREGKKAHEFLTENPHAIVVTTYGLLAEHEGFFNQYRWNIHIYDEAQNLKTITAKRTTVSRKTPARFKLCLTGTPLENHLGEFYSLVDLVLPGSLGAFDQFRKSFLNSYAPDPERVKHLKSKTRPLVLRRTKSAILKELPEKSESTVRIPFTEKQRTIYRDIALSWNTRVKKAITDQGESKSQLIMLTALLRLRQACSSPASIPSVKYTETPPKVSLLIDNLKGIIESGESALVFTQFLGTFEILEKEMKNAGIPYYAIHGKVSRKDRELNIQKFKESDKGGVMLMTLKTGGVGLNLTKASYVFHLEPWWNPAVENQATDRTHRIGQTKPVQVYRYIMSESVEEKIEVLKQRKSAQFASLFSEAENDQEIDPGVNLHLTQKDFEYLLS